MNNCKPTKISELPLTCAKPKDLVPIVLCGQNAVTTVQEIARTVLKLVSACGDENAICLATLALNIAMQAEADSSAALKDLSTALAYATKAYKLACQVCDRLLEIENKIEYVITLDLTLKDLRKLVNNHTTVINKLVDAGKIEIEEIEGGYKVFLTQYNSLLNKNERIEVATLTIPKYTAGDYIKIENGEISTTLKAGNNISIDQDGKINVIASGTQQLALDDLSDVTMSSLAAGLVLYYDGEKWINSSLETLIEQYITKYHLGLWEHITQDDSDYYCIKNDATATIKVGPIYSQG